MRVHTFLYLLVLYWTLSKPCWAQEHFVEPQSRLISAVPFVLLNGGVIMVRAQLNNYPDTLNFILDTGSGGISLDSSTVEEFGIPVVPSDKTIRGIAGIRKVSFLYNATLHFPTFDVEGLNFHVNDYEILSSVYGIKIDGIIGYSFFSRYIVEINYDLLSIQVFTQGEYRYPPNGHMLTPMFTSIPIQTTQFSESKIFRQRFYLDTGAGLNLLLSERYVADSNVLRRKRRPPVVTQAEGLGGKMNMRLTTVRELRIGPYRFKKVPTMLFNDDYNITAYPHLGGLIGNDLLRRFNTTFNYAKQEVHIVPNSHYHDMFDYAYTGLSFYFIEEKIVVDDVVPGSPSDKAGFRQDDVIVAIDNNFSNNIQIYKTMMQTTGERLRILVSRNNQLLVLNMKPIRIL
jgi:hypothetical protein